MAQKKSDASKASSTKTKTQTTKTATRTSAEMKEWYEKYAKSVANYENANNALKQLVDPSKSVSRTYSTFSKETLRTYMANPISNEKNLRNLSRYLYYRSSAYRKLIWFNATMIDPKARAVVPLIDLVKDNDPEKIKKNYYQTLQVLENMNLTLELFKMYVIAWREDVAFGCAFYDDTGYFILPLDPDVCKVTSIYYTGDLGFSMDMTYFRNRQPLLEWLGSPFTEMYNAYGGDNAAKWQPMPDEYAVCFKVNIDDHEVPTVPLMTMFNSLINLADLEDIQAVADEQQIYKLISATIPLISGSDDSDDFAVDPDTAIKYFNKMVETLPDYIGAIISPIPLDTINFGEDQTVDVNKIENATKTVYNSAGGAQILNSSTVTGSVAWTGAITADMKYAQASLLPQTQAYINRFLSYQVSKPAKVIMLEVSPYTKQSMIESMQKNLQYGFQSIITLNSLYGFSELQTLSLQYLENEVLDFKDKIKVLQSSNTQSSSGKESGGQEKSLTDLTDEGEASIDKRDRANG